MLSATTGAGFGGADLYSLRQRGPERGGSRLTRGDDKERAKGGDASESRKRGERYGGGAEAVHGCALCNSIAYDLLDRSQFDRNPIPCIK